MRRPKGWYDQQVKRVMALADACLVRMSELRSAVVVMTLDGDFRLYRRHGRQAIPVVLPERR
jgi:uncharacterized protein